MVASFSWAGIIRIKLKKLLNCKIGLPLTEKEGWLREQNKGLEGGLTYTEYSKSRRKEIGLGSNLDTRSSCWLDFRNVICRWLLYTSCSFPYPHPASVFEHECHCIYPRVLYFGYVGGDNETLWFISLQVERNYIHRLY